MHRSAEQSVVHDFGAVSIRLVLGGADTGGLLEVFEFIGQPGARNPPPHVHQRASETFCVIDGSLRVHCGDETIDAGPGAVVHVPIGTRHWFSYPGPGVCRFMSTFAPAIGMDRYFAELHRLVAHGGPPDAAKIKELMAAYDSALA